MSETSPHEGEETYEVLRGKTEDSNELVTFSQDLTPQGPTPGGEEETKEDLGQRTRRATTEVSVNRQVKGIISPPPKKGDGGAKKQDAKRFFFHPKYFMFFLRGTSKPGKIE